MSGPSDLPNGIPVDKLKAKADEAKGKAQQALNDAPPEVKQAVQKSQGFYEENKRVIHTVLVGVVVLKVYKRKVAKASAKAVVKAIAKNSSNTKETLPDLVDVLTDLRATPGMAYIPHGGGMVHLLKGKDAIVTVFGEFEKMTNEEIWNQVANILNLNVRV